jgi:5'-3' exonuclease
MSDKGKVLIDGDIIAYRAAFSTQDKSPREAERKTEELISYVINECVGIPFASPSDYQVYLTGSGNFRYDIAKSHDYKGNRKDTEKPLHLYLTREYLTKNYGAITSSGEEADDLISKAAAALNYHCVVASIDKDMLQIPCWHYNFGRGEWSVVEPFQGTKFFYTQILTGDRADNIIGINGIGPVKAEKLLSECKTEENLWEAVVKAYNGDKERVIENARLLWLRRYDNQLWEPPKP